MKIIIAGAGNVGFHLAKMLSSEAQDIYLLDKNEERLQLVSSQIDVYTIRGDANSIETMEKDNNLSNCIYNWTQHHTILSLF